MVKRKASTPSSSDSEGATENTQSSNSRKKFNHLVQSASLSSKNQLLQRVLANSNISGVLNKSVSSSDDSELESRNVVKNSIKKLPVIQKRKREVVSSSDEASEEETKLPVSLSKIKQEKQLETDNSSSEEEKSLPIANIKPGTSRVTKKSVLPANREDNSDSNSDNVLVNTKIVKRHIKKEMRSADSESSSEEITVREDRPFAKISSSENEENDVSLGNIKLETLSTRGADSSDEEIDNTNAVNQTLDEDEQLMQRIEKTIGSRSLTENNYPGRKVKVLQDVRFTPEGVSPKERLIATYPGIQPLQSNVDLDFSDSEDVYLLRIPKNVDPKLLKKLDIDLENECKIDIGEKYSVKSTSKPPDPTLVISNNCKVLQFKSNIRMKKYIKSKKKPNIAIPEKVPVPLPNKLKNRHPLFGSDFEHKINLSEQVEKRLDDAIANILKMEKKQRKKLKKKSGGVEMDDKKEEIFNLFDSFSFINNSRVKEHSEDSAFGSSSSLDKVKKKKTKKDKESGVEETLTKLKMELSDNDLGSVSQKKKKNVFLQDELSKQGIKNELDDELPVEATPVPKKHKKKLAINSTLISDFKNTPRFNPEVSSISPEVSSLEKRSKKKDKNRSLEESKLISNLLDTIKSDLTPLKKAKKKKHKSQEEDALLFNSF